MSVRDILDQLRDPKCKFSREQVADEIERLRAERDALRAVLAKIRRDYSSAFMPEDAARIDAALKDDQS